MSFQKNLKEILGDTDLKWAELARKTGINIKTIENYKKENPSMPPADKAVKIARALGVTVEFLIDGKNSKSETSILYHRKNKEIIDMLTKLDNDNYELVYSTLKKLLGVQEKKSRVL